MCRLTDYCIYDSAEQPRKPSTCPLSAPGSKGQIAITVQEGERLLVYDLEKYVGERPVKRPDRLLIGQVGDDGPWVVLLVDLKSGTGWDKALKQFQEVLPTLGKGGDRGGEQHHQECGAELPLGRSHRVIAVVIGQVGREYKKSIQRAGLGGRKRQQKQGGSISWSGKAIRIVPPMSGKVVQSLRDFWVKLGIPVAEAR